MFMGIFFMLFIALANSKYFEDDLNVKQSSVVEVRAVFINCQINENHLPYGSESLRFQREEIFKHNVLRDCKKKLALTVKMISDSGQSSSDEYIPIEHVFDGLNKKRVRLLNPYILRLRREPPYETYKLHELDTFSVVLTSSKGKNTQINTEEIKNRLRRSIQLTEIQDWVIPQQKGDPDYAQMFAKTNPVFDRNALQWHRNKQNDYDKLRVNNPFEYNIQKTNSPFKENIQISLPYSKDHIRINFNKNMPNIMVSNVNESKQLIENLGPENKKDQLDNTEHIFKLYEIGEPDIWFKAQLQLLEKLSTPEGKTVWKDLTREEPAQITSLYPEWTNQEVNMRYRCAECIPKGDFKLPTTGICLLVPVNGINDEINNDKMGDFIIVPVDDIEAIEENSDLPAINNNSSIKSAAESEKRPRRILVRLSRALFSKDEDNFAIINDGTVEYLRIPYRQPHHAQVELEAKADENQLVYVGSSGRLTTAISESTRRTRAILTVQATNTGLAAARLRPKIRECTPELMKFDEDELGIAVKSILIPPMHTHKFSLELPLEMIGDFAYCSLALINDNDESVAVRDVRIKRGDRCFCVWHCQCVCLNEDPKLLCQEMPEQQQHAAGLPPRDRPRQVRAACYPDVVTTNLLVIVFGVIVVLLALGLTKACLGLLLRCVGSWGIDQMLQTPRRLDRYYESSLRDRPVKYDDDGWPVHPDTMKRTVRLISKPMEFMLNIIFFVTMPWLVLWKSTKQIISHCQQKENNNDGDYRANAKKFYSSQDMQGKNVKEARHWRRRRRRLNKWMSPQAEELSTDIWRNGLAPQAYRPTECMQPLLREDRFQGKMYEFHSHAVDSEHNDTEYVLMQMQNSRESLAKNLQNCKPTSSVID